MTHSKQPATASKTPGREAHLQRHPLRLAQPARPATPATPRLSPCRLPALGLFALAIIALSACGEDDAPGQAKDLKARTTDYRSWSSPTNFDTRHPSDTLHSDEVIIYYNQTMSDVALSVDDCRAAADNDSTLAPGDPFVLNATVDEWPSGSIIVKEGYSGSDMEILAFMEKTDNGWFFAEFDGDGEILFSGRPRICTSCHDGAMSDSIFSTHLSYLCPPPIQL